MFHECLGVVNAVPGEQGVCLGCLGVVFYCLGVFWGLLEGVSVLSEVSGSAFYSNLIYINCALIKSLTFSKRRGGPRCLKYQNVPTSRSFWPIGNPWERFQSWDIRVYFIPVPDDHTVAHYALHKMGAGWLVAAQSLRPSRIPRIVSSISRLNTHHNPLHVLHYKAFKCIQSW